MRKTYVILLSLCFDWLADKNILTLLVVSKGFKAWVCLILSFIYVVSAMQNQSTFTRVICYAVSTLKSNMINVRLKINLE